MGILYIISNENLVLYLIITIALLILVCVIYFISEKKNKIKPISEEERFDSEKEISALSKIEEELISESDQKPKVQSDVEEMLTKMQKDLNEKENPVQLFEEEQEANAIISYKELLEKVEIEKNKNRDEIENKKNIGEIEEQKKFHTSEIISPIYGRQNKEQNETNTDQNEEFLQSLKEFRNKL